MSRVSQLVRNFHSDEEGLEALQVVMIVAIAGLIMITAATVGKDAVEWMGEQWKNLKNKGNEVKLNIG